MTSRERVIRTLRHQPVDRAPRDLWTLPGVGLHRADELERLQRRYPSDFIAPRFRYGPSRRAQGEPAQVGEYVDEWGSRWRVAQEGVVGEVVAPPLADWAALADWEPPGELLEEADLGEVEASCAETDLFVLAGTGVRPFERLQFLRGSQRLFYDLALRPPELEELLARLHEYNLREMRLWAATAVDGVSFIDDWGTQRALLISPPLWRELFKPLYREYCEILHAAGKWAFFHSDGHIAAIYPDLIEIGVDAVNSQLFCMDLEELGRRYGGQITFWGEIDRQGVLPWGTPEQVREAVRRVRRALDRGRGGVIAQCEWGINDPYENIEAVFAAWEEPRPREVET